MMIRGYESADLERCRSLWVEVVERHREIYEDPSIGGENPKTQKFGWIESHWERRCISVALIARASQNSTPVDAF